MIVCQSPVDFEDFAKVGVKTRLVKPPRNKVETLGTVVDIVYGVTRGATCQRTKLNQLAKVLNHHLARMEREEKRRREEEEMPEAERKARAKKKAEEAKAEGGMSTSFF